MHDAAGRVGDRRLAAVDRDALHRDAVRIVDAAHRRIAVDGGKATVADATGRIVHSLIVGSAAGGAGTTITLDKTIITGTNDLVLAALLAAPEVAPELRMMAACERVLVARQDKSVP
jgi:hypothetical protein